MIVSVIIPAYDEADTLGRVIDSILELRIPDVEFQIIVVCSMFPNRKTFDVADSYKERIETLVELYPNGKGSAVRNGLTAATGEIIIIQDADLEYNVSDYERLLTPILSGKCDFVLGRRVAAGGAGPMRKFKESKFAAWVMNIGHNLFALALNTILCTRMRDPFTMFKIFRHRCIHGMKFNCNRFDFDFELVSKLIRAGYVPTEIPVAYSSRGFEEGKKIHMIRDPLTWIWFLTKLLFRAI